MVFKKNSHAFFKNNDEGIIVAPGSDDERSYHANAGAACVLWTAPDVVQRQPEEDADDVLHVEPGTASGTWRLTVRQQAVAPRAARTIHGVQGMGFDVVVYVLLKPSEYLRANGHYTSITRARKKVCLLGDLTAFGNGQARQRCPPDIAVRPAAGHPVPADAEREEDAAAPSYRARESCDAGSQQSRAAHITPPGGASLHLEPSHWQGMSRGPVRRLRTAH